MYQYKTVMKSLNGLKINNIVRMILILDLYKGRVREKEKTVRRRYLF